MKRILLLTIFGIGMGLMGWGQPWNYDFGTGTGTHPTNTISTTFLTSTPANGGTYRVRTGNAGGTMVLANPGTSLGTATELQINAATSTSANKFGVYDWTSPSTVAYLKYKYRTTSTSNGNLNISMGVNTIASDNQGYTSHYNNSIASLTITYSSGAISSVVRRISGSNTTITGSGFSKDTDQLVEIYANNGTGSVNYTRSGSNSLATKTWDLWVDGTKVVTNAATAGSLASGTNLSGFGFFAESSTGNVAWIYIDDLEYSNALPTGNTAPTVTTLAVTSIGTTTATGNGEITATGGANATARGVCWDVYGNPDPDISDSHSTESGDFGTGTFTGAITGLTPGIRYKVVAYATNPTGTGYGSAVDFYALSNEPTNHPSGLSATANSTTQITVNWTDATGDQLPSAYLVKAAVDPSTPTAPSDGAPESDGTFVKNVNQGTQQAVFTGLDPSTTYNFAIWPYTNSGENIDYKLGSQPTTSGTTLTPLGTPVATEASNISTIGFTANWNAAASATSYRLDVSEFSDFQTTGGNASDLFISEYIDGSSGTNKAIEIFNGTGASVNLSNYKIWIINNGSKRTNDT